VGKSFLASALAQKACRDGYCTLYLRAAALSRELALARADGSLRHLLARLARIDVLVIDDWAMAPLGESEHREMWEICEDRYQTRSTVLTSQLPVARWHKQIGVPTIADGILDRLVHNAPPIEMSGRRLHRWTAVPGHRKTRRTKLFLPITPTNTSSRGHTILYPYSNLCLRFYCQNPRKCFVRKHVCVG
jgi:IstB-like ATP binding protein